RFPAALDAMIRIEHMNDARNARLRGPSARIAGKTHRPSGCAMIRTITRQDLVATSEEARDLDGVLVGLGAAVGEEEGVDIARCDLGKLRAQTRPNFCSHKGVRISKRRRLFADGLNDALIAVTDVDGHELAVEVD